MSEERLCLHGKTNVDCDECCKACYGTGRDKEGDECIECRGRGDYIDEELVCVEMFTEGGRR